MAYNSSNTSDSGSFYSFTLAEIWISSIFYILLIVASVIGNFLIMGVVYSNKRMRTVTHYFIINNTVADLLVTVLGIPVAAREQILGTDTIPFGGFPGELFCRMLIYTQDISCSSSIFTLVAIATDRFCATFFPFKRLITVGRAKWIMLMIWVVSMVLPLPLVFVIKIALDPNNGEYYCTERWSVYSSLVDMTGDQLEHAYTVFMFVVWYAVPLVIMSILYGTIIKKVWKRKIPGQETVTSQQIQQRTKMNVLKMLISVVICFAVCWLPYHVMFLGYPSPSFPPPLNLWMFANFMRYSNSSVTPWIYLICSKDYRKGVHNILLKCICKKPSYTSYFSSSVNLERMSRRCDRGSIALKAYTNTNFNAEDEARVE